MEAEEQRQWGKGAVWSRTLPGSMEAEVLVPLDRGLADFAHRMADVLAELESVEPRSQTEIFTDLQTASSDVIRMRLAATDAADGSLPLEDAVLLVEKTRDVMMAAACAAIQPREYYPSRKPAAAQDYLRGVRLGQTERGSYVVTVQSPVSPALHQPTESALAEPFERQVTLTLSQSLTALRQAADQVLVHNDLKPVKDAVASGVSANLCQAVASVLQSERSGRTVEVSFSWAPSRPVLHEVSRRISFPADAYPVLQEAARVFREMAPRESFDLIGFIKVLDREPRATRGEVVVLGFVDGRPRRVTLRLSGDDYQAAVRAHERNIPLRCAGTLQRAGRGYELAQPSGIVLLDEESLIDEAFRDEGWAVGSIGGEAS